MESYDSIVVGCGIMGSSISYHLSKRGSRVLCLEQFSLNHKNGSSHGKSRIIRSAYAEHPSYVPLLKRAFELWRELENEWGKEELLRMTGALFVGRPESYLVSGARRSAEMHHLPYELLSSSQIRERFEMFRPFEDEVGILDPGAGMLFPERCILANVDLAQEKHGCTFHFNEKVSTWKASDAGIEVKTEQGNAYTSKRIIFAAGSWLSDLVPSLNLPLKCERQVLLWFRPLVRPELFKAGSIPIFSWWEKDGSNFYGLPDVGDGLKAVGHHGGEFTHPDKIRREVTAEDVAPVREFLKRHVPWANGLLIHSETCMYTDTPDDHFLIDFHPSLENVILVSPCSGHGFKFGSVVGEIVSDLALKGKTHHDISLFKISRLVASTS